MTVKCIDSEDKQLIAYQYKYEKQQVKDLALAYQCSARTIQRVLIEYGVSPMRKRHVKAPLKLPEPTFMETVKSFFKAALHIKSKKAND